MFENNVDYPKAVASYDDDGVDAAIQWSCQHMEAGDTLTVWTYLKSNLENCSKLKQLVTRYSDVDHVTRRSGDFIRRKGPVLMAWADMDDIGYLVRHGANRIRALCVIAFNEDEIRPWVSAAEATILGDDSAWPNSTPAISPIVVEAMKDLTARINHNNTISGGYEKNDVVSTLTALRDAGISMDGEAMQGWALANGWSSGNPQKLAEYVNDINAGKRPRYRHTLNAKYVDILRDRIAQSAPGRSSSETEDDPSAPQ